MTHNLTPDQKLLGMYRFQLTIVLLLCHRHPDRLPSTRYQFNCDQHNDGNLCNWLMTFPARINLGQIAFVIPRPSAPPPAPPPAPSCTGLGDWCNVDDHHCQTGHDNSGLISVTKLASPTPDGCTEVIPRAPNRPWLLSCACACVW